MSNAELEYLLSNGLTETTESDDLCYSELQGIAVPFTAHWIDSNNAVKSMQWDTSWEKYITHCAELIDFEGRESYLPWNLYKSLNLNWVDGYNYKQGTGDCAGNTQKNSGKASQLITAKRTGKTPKEIALSVTYSMARGNGKVRHGSGCNLNPLAKWACTAGNYWTSDFGKYDVGRYVSKYKKGSEQDKHALQTQSIAIFLPEPTFDYCYAVCNAGFGIAIGSHIYPTGSTLNGDNLGQASSWKNGGHAVSLVAACKGKSGKRYVYMENSHLQNYVADQYNPAKQWGCWLDENNIKQMSTFKYGVWYCNLLEMDG